MGHNNRLCTEWWKLKSGVRMILSAISSLWRYSRTKEISFARVWESVSNSYCETCRCACLVLSLHQFINLVCRLRKFVYWDTLLNMWLCSTRNFVACFLTINLRLTYMSPCVSSTATNGNDWKLTRHVGWYIQKRCLFSVYIRRAEYGLWEMWEETWTSHYTRPMEVGSTKHCGKWWSQGRRK